MEFFIPVMTILSSTLLLLLLVLLLLVKIKKAQLLKVPAAESERFLILETSMVGRNNWLPKVDL